MTLTIQYLLQKRGKSWSKNSNPGADIFAIKYVVNYLCLLSWLQSYEVSQKLSTMNFRVQKSWLDKMEISGMKQNLEQ